VITVVHPPEPAAAGRTDTVFSPGMRPHQHIRPGPLDLLHHHTGQMRQQAVQPLMITADHDHQSSTSTSHQVSEVDHASLGQSPSPDTPHADRGSGGALRWPSWAVSIWTWTGTCNPHGVAVQSRGYTGRLFRGRVVCCPGLGSIDSIRLG